MESMRCSRENQVLLGMYKLLGETTIALMDDGGVSPWNGDLYKMRPVTYLVNGTVSWIYVVVLLSCWALLVSSGALWLLALARPRWTPSLDGNEMFRFGAQCAAEVNDFRSTDFRGCSAALNMVPGTVGVLPGRSVGYAIPRDKGFIGLSENEARSNIAYTLDRREAAPTRIP